MKKKAEKSHFLEYILSEVLSNVDGVSYRAMFGGYGIYKDGVIFALIANDQLYFKVGESNLEDYKNTAVSHLFTLKVSINLQLCHIGNS